MYAVFALFSHSPLTILHSPKSYQSLFPEQEPGGDGNHDGEDDGDDKAYGVGLHAVDEVHSEERGDECWQHEDDGHGSQRTHDGVHVVVDD